MSTITSLDQLREHYADPQGRTLKKQLSFLDKHCKHFISLSRFLVMSTVGPDGKLDASPRGGAAGFVTVLDDSTLLIPDWPGNNRLDSFSNIVETAGVGLLFMIAGVNETLRVNGEATLCTDESLREQCTENGKLPKLVIRVDVHEAYLHCAKAFMRSKLWDVNEQTPRDALPTMGKMINDQINENGPDESQEEMEARYSKQLY